jgi:hypothetical protein
VRTVFCDARRMARNETRTSRESPRWHEGGRKSRQVLHGTVGPGITLSQVMFPPTDAVLAPRAAASTTTAAAASPSASHHTTTNPLPSVRAPFSSPRPPRLLRATRGK